MTDFRVWDGEEYHYPVDESGMGISLIDLENKCFVDKSLVAPLYFTDCVLEKVTGFYDKEKRKIYDGDVFMIGNARDLSAYFFIVKWNKLLGKWLTYLKNSNGRSMDLIDIASSGRIIGNIHENGELLK